jgi:hypothetical protein
MELHEGLVMRLNGLSLNIECSNLDTFVLQLFIPRLVTFYQVN